LRISEAKNQQLIVFAQIHFLLIVNRQGKIRLTKWYQALESKDKSRIVREVTNTVTKREQKSCNFFEYKDYTIVYRRWVL